MHCFRRIPERPRHPARWAEVKEVIEAANLDIPVIINGDIFCYADIQRARETTGTANPFRAMAILQRLIRSFYLLGASSVMIGRGAMADPSIFRPTPIPPFEIHKEYLKKCIQCDNIFQNTKYTLLRMHTENPKMGLQHPIGEALVKSKTYDDIWFVRLRFLSTLSG